MFQFWIANWENRMKIFSKCISCHETGIVCTPWGLRTKKGSVAEYLLLLERTEKPVLLLLYGHLTVSYAFLWRPPVENCILGIWNHLRGTTQAWHCRFIESHLILGEGKIGNFKWINPQLTGHLVHQDAWGNDASVLREELLQFFLSHGFRQATDVQICISDGGRAWTRIGNLQREDKAGQVKAQKQHVLSRNFAQQTRPCVPFVQVEKRRAGAVHNFRQRWIKRYI